jgi:ribosome maturation factor RimP
MIGEDRVREAIEQTIQGSELFLVDVKVHGEDRIFVEVDRMDGVSIEDCVELNKQVRAILDEEERGLFELNVSSPGLDERFKVFRQYRKNLGKEVSVITRSGQRMKGVLDDVSDDGILLRTRKRERVEGKKKKELVEKEHRLSFDELKETKAVIGIK